MAEIVKTYLQQGTYVAVDGPVLLKAMDLMAAYDFQFFDAIIVAAALVSGCDTLYSEDMHNGLVIEKRLKIVNPFKG